MARIVLGVTGSVAALETPDLFRALRGAGHEVRIVATEPALAFFQPREINVPRALFRDADEWPDPGWSRGDAVLHIEFRDWADLLVVAPLDANTLGKFALGLCDNFLTCIYRAWDFGKPAILAPAMNTRMWDNPSTRRHLRMILEDQGDGRQSTDWTLDEAPEVYARHAPGIVLVPPQCKRLACGDVGIGAMADVLSIAEVVRQMTATAGPD